jgi:hypothetical protein
MLGAMKTFFSEEQPEALHRARKSVVKRWVEGIRGLSWRALKLY